MVNRIWQEHFGAGLVRTASDFGLRAEPRASRVARLAGAEFIKSGWKMKSHAPADHALCHLPAGGRTRRRRWIQTIGCSRIFRARLDFEELRDAMLAVSGELAPKVGGKAEELFTASNKRRTLYGLIDRQFLPATFRVFDFANPDIHSAQRHDYTIRSRLFFS